MSRTPARAGLWVVNDVAGQPAALSPESALGRSWAQNRLAVHGGQLALLLLVFAGWELCVTSGWLNEATVGQPSRMWTFFVASLTSGELLAHLKVTLYEELLGFVIGMGGGTLVGLSLWWSRTASRILEPFAIVFNGIPKIALAPPMIIWFGIFETSKIVLAATICFVVAWLSAYAGTRTVDRDLLDMIKAMGGSRRQAFVRIVVPSSMPWIISAAKINIGFALVGAVVGEFVAANHGLGYLAVQASILFQVSRLWMVIFVIMFVAAVQYWLLLWLEGKLLRWAGDEGLHAVA